MSEWDRNVTWRAAQHRRCTRLDADAPVVVPAGVKVTVCPPCRVERFAFTPVPGWRGQITQDWLDARLVAATNSTEYLLFAEVS